MDAIWVIAHPGGGGHFGVANHSRRFPQLRADYARGKAGGGQEDAGTFSVDMSVDQAPVSVVHYYESELARQGWFVTRFTDEDKGLTPKMA